MYGARVTPADLAARLAELPDNELRYHGFTCYMRDYELIVRRVPAHPEMGIADVPLRFLFRICPEVSVRSRVGPEVWSRSMDDALVSQHHVTRQSEGYIWGVQRQVLSGATVVGDSERARWWAGQVGVEFHEVEISASAHQISLVFADLQVEVPAPDYTPFVVGY